VLSHVTADIRSESAASAAVHYKVAPGATLRGRDEILRFFAGLELIDPGLVQVPDWRPGGPEPTDAGKVWILGGVGRKPGPSPARRM
jgi:S-adenosyl methyltransferase